jgi:enoyl-CoA hydratase/carnithine racemase
MKFKSLRFKRQGAIGILLLNRPAKRNALSDAMLAELGSFFRAPPKGVMALVLHGAGKHFCAGLDLAELGQDAGLLMESLAAGIARSEPEAKRRMKNFLEKRSARVKRGA